MKGDSETAQEVMDALRLTQPPQKALPILNGLVGLVKGNHQQSLEVEEARSGAFPAFAKLERCCTAVSRRTAFGRRRYAQPCGG
jgi:hypothetical protein